MIDTTEEALEEVEKLMNETIKGDKDIKMLQKVPGIGPLTALAFIEKQGHITKSGNGYFRSLVYQASWAMIRSKKESFLKGKYEYMVKNGKSKKKAITAVARKLCELMYSMVKNQKPYSPRSFKVPNDIPKNLAEQALKQVC